MVQTDTRMMLLSVCISEVSDTHVWTKSGIFGTKGTVPNGERFMSWRHLQINLPLRKKVLGEKGAKGVTKLCVNEQRSGKKVILSPAWPRNNQNGWKTGCRGSTPRRVGAWKGYPFRAEPSHTGHHWKYPPPPPEVWLYRRTSVFRTRLIRSPHYFERRSNALGFALPLYASPVISKPCYFELFFHFPWDFKIAGLDCIYPSSYTSVYPCSTCIFIYSPVNRCSSSLKEKFEYSQLSLYGHLCKTDI